MHGDLVTAIAEAQKFWERFVAMCDRQDQELLNLFTEGSPI